MEDFKQSVNNMSVSTAEQQMVNGGSLLSVSLYLMNTIPKYNILYLSQKSFCFFMSVNVNLVVVDVEEYDGSSGPAGEKIHQ